MQGQLELAAEPDHARRGVVQLAAGLGGGPHASSDRAAARVAAGGSCGSWKPTSNGNFSNRPSLPSRGARRGWRRGRSTKRAAKCSTSYRWLSACSAGSLRDVEIDVEVASQRDGHRGADEELWRSAQQFALLAPWLASDAEAITILEETVPADAKVQSRWRSLVSWFDLTLAERVARLVRDPTGGEPLGRGVRPGDLVVLSERFDPRVRVVLDVVATSGDAKVVFYDADEDDAQRAFLASRVVATSWRDDATLEAAG